MLKQNILFFFRERLLLEASLSPEACCRFPVIRCQSVLAGFQHYYNTALLAVNSGILEYGIGNKRKKEESSGCTLK